MKRPTRLRIEALDDRCLPSLSPVASLPVGNFPLAVVTADFNHDGQLDLATANYNSVSVLLGDGRGGFGAANDFTAGSRPGALAVGDLDGDGHLDLVTASWVGRGVGVLLGNGDGTFREPVAIGQGEAALSVAVGDFNGDGLMDVAAGDWDYDFFSYDDELTSIHVLLGDGAGGFQASHTLTFPGAGGDVLALADLDDDSHLDVVTQIGPDEYGRVTVGVLMGNGDGTLRDFAWASDGPLLGVGDFTGDGVPDLITAGWWTVSVHPGNGDGTFAPPVTSSNGPETTAGAAADFNGDGRLDLVTMDDPWVGTGTVSVLLGNGDGTLFFAGEFAAGSWPMGLAVGDFDAAGRPDVAVADFDANAVLVLRNDGGWPARETPRLRIGDATVTEGNAGTGLAVFTATLSVPFDQPVTVAYATADGTALAGSDYQTASGTLTFAPGETTKTITVPVIGDRLVEPNETFVVNLGAPTNALIVDGQGAGTIVDDEPRVSIGDVIKLEGRKNQMTLFTFTVILSAAYDQPVTVSFRTTDGTATTADNDYVARTGTLTFAPGETTKTITIEVKGDNKWEAGETFYLDLFGSSGNALLVDGRGVGTIVNDD